MTSPRVVITGVGAVSPLGLTAQDLWDGLVNGQSGIGPITAFDPAGFTCQLAGQVPEYKIRNHIPKNSRKAAKLMSRDIELAIIAANEALHHAQLNTPGMESAEPTTLEPTRTAIILGAGLISCDLVELAPAVAASLKDGHFDLKQWGLEGIQHVTPLWLLKYLPNMLACHVSLIHDIQGPSNTITCAEASGHLAVIEAMQIIQRGSADAALTGGTEAKVNPIVMARQCLIKRATSQANDTPDQACRPFDAKATGSVFGEGAGLLVLESLDTAKARQAPILAEIVGFGQSNCLNTPYEALESDGKGIQIAVSAALKKASLSPDQINLIIPHGTGVPQDDAAESTALGAVFGDSLARIPVLPTKSMLSNTGTAAGALDLIAAVKAMQENKIPGAVNCDEKAPNCGLAIHSEPLERPIHHALCCSYSYGGQTTAVILKTLQDEA
ncbi:MAG: beta-ketoacyl-[acyl-carrier-protein] synthase family protein [Planctomycetes bacterium]|nr:beta-ketoacyl-[acyl-carrier-protein] synthase family protein [Planctomycetota bacterium]